MTRHVTHLLAAYVEGQLRPRRAAAVHRHVAACPACREKLARHERVAYNLRLALGQNPAPRQSQLRQWWSVISLTPALPARGRAIPALLPIALCLILLVVPLAAGIGLTSPPGAAPLPQSTALSPELETTLEPPAIAFVAEVSMASTSAASVQHPAAVATPGLPGTPLLATPVPPAPTAP
jgi:anti-sigma factor RsiW